MFANVLLYALVTINKSYLTDITKLQPFYQDIVNAWISVNGDKKPPSKQSTIIFLHSGSVSTPLYCFNGDQITRISIQINIRYMDYELLVEAIWALMDWCLYILWNWMWIIIISILELPLRGWFLEWSWEVVVHENGGNYQHRKKLYIWW